jgi:hypothetical protein
VLTPELGNIALIDDDRLEDYGDSFQGGNFDRFDLLYILGPTQNRMFGADHFKAGDVICKHLHSLTARNGKDEMTQINSDGGTHVITDAGYRWSSILHIARGSLVAHITVDNMTTQPLRMLWTLWTPPGSFLALNTLTISNCSIVHTHNLVLAAQCHPNSSVKLLNCIGPATDWVNLIAAVMSFVGQLFTYGV